ncbi:MAG: hypothetical protein ACJA0C_000807 [Candidatus Endobugula sp.]|jgi:hypothetical protein
MIFKYIGIADMDYGSGQAFNTDQPIRIRTTDQDRHSTVDQNTDQDRHSTVEYGSGQALNC